MGQIIDGKALALKKEESLKQKLSILETKPLVFSILVGNDPASHLYTNMKQKKAEELGIDFQPLKFDEGTQFEYVADRIKNLNRTSDVTGIMIQLPLPKPFLGNHSKYELTDLIAPVKDIDGLTQGKIFMSATVKSVISILNSIKQDYANKMIAVVGSEGEVGKPLVEVLREKGAKNILRVDKKITNSSLNDIKNADTVISATGVNNLIDDSQVKDGAILIDVGLGDFTQKALEKSSLYTPKQGGVGPMTIASLMENIYEATKKLN